MKDYFGIFERESSEFFQGKGNKINTESKNGMSLKYYKRLLCLNKISSFGKKIMRDLRNHNI